MCQQQVDPAQHRGGHPLKTCDRCSKTLPIAKYAAHPSAADGYRRTCKSCVRSTPRRDPAPQIESQRRATLPPSGYVLAGLLVHRVVLWPFVRPQTGEQLVRFKDHMYVTENATSASFILQLKLRRLMAEDSRQNMDALLAVTEIDGPWGDRSIEQLWTDLSSEHRAAIVRILDSAVKGAARGVSDFIRSVGSRGGRVICAWAEVPLFAIDGFFGSPTDGPTRYRADLVAWRQNGDIDVLDLKIGSTTPPEWVLKADRDQVSQYVGEVERRVSSTRRVRGSLLYVARSKGDTRLVRV